MATATATASRPQPLPPAKLPRSLLSSVRPSARRHRLISLSVSVSSVAARLNELPLSILFPAIERCIKCNAGDAALNVYGSQCLPSSKIGPMQD